MLPQDKQKICKKAYLGFYGTTKNEDGSYSGGEEASNEGVRYVKDDFIPRKITQSSGEDNVDTTNCQHWKENMFKISIILLNQKISENIL